MNSSQQQYLFPHLQKTNDLLSLHLPNHQTACLPLPPPPPPPLTQLLSTCVFVFPGSKAEFLVHLLRKEANLTLDPSLCNQKLLSSSLQCTIKPLVPIWCLMVVHDTREVVYRVNRISRAIRNTDALLVRALSRCQKCKYYYYYYKINSMMLMITMRIVIILKMITN